MFGFGKKAYKEYKKVNIGLSSMCELIVRSIDKVELLKFSKNGYYYAYVTKENVKLNKQMKMIGEYEQWIRIYDDDELTFHAFGDMVKVYQQDDDIIIQVIEPRHIFVNDNEPIFRSIDIGE